MEVNSFNTQSASIAGQNTPRDSVADRSASARQNESRFNTNAVEQTGNTSNQPNNQASIVGNRAVQDTGGVDRTNLLNANRANLNINSSASTSNSAKVEQDTLRSVVVEQPLNRAAQAYTSISNTARDPDDAFRIIDTFA